MRPSIENRCPILPTRERRVDRIAKLQDAFLGHRLVKLAEDPYGDLPARQRLSGFS